MGDPDPVVRGHAAWALGRIGGQAAAEILYSAEVREENLTVLDEIKRGQATLLQS
jgi:epoxyqueuosine reductase